MNKIKTSFSDDGQYPEVANQASIDDNVFNNFKSHPSYTLVLEHVSGSDGSSYLEIIKNVYPFLLPNFEKYKTNDSIGNPTTYNYDGIGQISPTTLRYVKVLGDIVNNFGNLDGLDIVEIGCGYGGQAKIIMDTYNVNTYTFIDLPEVLNLIKKYLSKFNFDTSKFIFKDITELKDNEKYDIFISNYAYTECIEDVRKTYFDKVLIKSRMGYLTSNFLPYELMKSEVIDKFENCFRVEETPQTGSDNFIIIWK